MSELPHGQRAEVRRLPDRARYDEATIHTILDEGLVCHVGFATEGQPYVIPTIYARRERQLLLHGSPASRMLRDLGKGVPVCITVTLLDGLVLARSAFHHSMNYRSVVIFGTAHELTDPDEKEAALRAFVEHVVPGRSDDARGPNDYERGFTRVLCVDLEEASAKVRSGGPLDDEEDLGLPVWAGVIPLSLTPGVPVPDPAHPPKQDTPSYARDYGRPTKKSGE